MKSDLKNQFIEKLENIYKTHLIYRTIVVCDDDIFEYKNLLEKKEFSVYIVNSISNINYDALDYRIILIKNNIFEDFLNNLILNNNIDFYTFITFTDDNIKDIISKKYYNNSDILNYII